MKTFAIISAALLASVSIAQAVDLHIDQNAILYEADGKTPLMLCDPPVQKCTTIATVGSTIQFVLGIGLPDSSGRGGADPTNPKAGALAIRIYNKPKPELKPDEITMILSRADRILGPIMDARLHQVLSPDESDKK